MIIRKIKLEPFAGSAARTYSFNDGLNVLLGPNESGKSTFVNALKAILFINTDLTPSKFKTLMTDYLPITGGDTIHVAAELLYDNTIYTLEKYWGATRSVKLHLNGGTVFTSPDDIAEKMNRILGLNQGTYDNVLIIRQSSLAETIKAIESEAQASESIQQILRNSKFKMDGVSVPKLKKAVETKVAQYYDHWDILADRPENMRDIHNEWKQKVGLILSAYYRYRRAEKAFSEAEEYELRLDEYVKKIECLAGQLNCMQEYVDKYRQVYQDLSKRKSLELQKELILKDISELVEIQKNWPKIEIEKEYLSKDIEELNSRIFRLEEEERTAEKFESQRTLRDKYEKARKIYSDYLSEKLKLTELKKVTKQDIDEVSKVSKEYNEYRIKFEAQKLKLKITAKKNISLNLAEGFDSPQEISLNEGREYNQVLKGRINIENDQLRFSVISGNGNVDEIIEKLETSKKSFESILLKHSAQSESELIARAEIYKSQYDTAMALANELKKILGNQIYNDLEQQFMALEDLPPQRSIKEILKDLSDLKEKRKDREKDVAERVRTIQKWQQKYSGHEIVSDLHAEKKISLKTVEQEISQLKPLPEEFSDIDLFIKDFETKDNLYRQKKEELSELKIRRAEFEKQQPDYPLKELENEMLEAREHLERVKKEGQSILLIKRELENILLEIDADTFEPLKYEVTELLKQMTLNKYTSVSMDEVVPKGINYNGSKIPVDLLSAGTKDILALAVRLGMANFYLQDRSGFIIMDDPLVNLDPQRQKVAVDCIKKIASGRQVIILTCHPSHAGLFGEGILNISGN